MRYILSTNLLVSHRIAGGNRHTHIVKCVVTGESSHPPPSGEMVAYWSYRGIAMPGYIVSRGKEIDGTLPVPGSTTSPWGSPIDWRLPIVWRAGDCGTGAGAGERGRRRCGGKFRYIFAWPNPEQSRKITQVLLLRSGDAITNVPSGYNFITDDINRERKKDYLYMIGKTE